MEMSRRFRTVNVVFLLLFGTKKNVKAICKFKRWGRKLQPVGTNGNNCKLQMRWRRKAFVKALED
jgi:hypothetical protein